MCALRNCFEARRSYSTSFGTLRLVRPNWLNCLDSKIALINNAATREWWAIPPSDFFVWSQPFWSPQWPCYLRHVEANSRSPAAPSFSSQISYDVIMTYWQSGARLLSCVNKRSTSAWLRLHLKNLKRFQILAKYYRGLLFAAPCSWSKKKGLSSLCFCDCLRPVKYP